MKTLIVIFAMLITAIATSCNNQPATVKPAAEKNGAPVQREVVIIPASPPPEKNTTIILNKKGVQVESKKVGVTVQP